MALLFDRLGTADIWQWSNCQKKKKKKGCFQGSRDIKHIILNNLKVSL